VRYRDPTAVQATVSLDGAAVAMIRADPTTFVGLVGVPISAAAGEHPVVVTAVDAAGGTTEHAAALAVLPVAFADEGITLDEMAAQLLDPELRQAETEYVARTVWSAPPTQKLWSGAFQPPLPISISSPFGAQRAYNAGMTHDRHVGVDLRGAKGTPVRAVAPGAVVLAEALAVRGNTVWLDHGWGVQSGYYHLDAIDVALGDTVATGDVIGSLGATGRVTGPHLHWEVRAAGTPVQPLEFLLRDVGQLP
jgi:murein DD-endopeptidase MepM/ murein hydrolase activator NlpD